MLPPRLPPLPPSPLRFRDLLLLVVIVAASIFTLPLLLTLFAPGTDFTALPVVAGLFVGQSALMLFLTWLAVLRPNRLSLAEIGLRPTYQGWYRYALAGGVLCVPVVSAVNLLLQRLMGAPLENPQLQALAPQGFDWTSLIVMLLLVGVLAPFVEEIVFRGLLLGWLRRRLRFVYAAPISAILFAVSHGLPQLVPALFIMGLVLAAFAWRSGSLLPGMVVHGIFNSIMTLMLYVGLAGMEGF